MSTESDWVLVWMVVFELLNILLQPIPCVFVLNKDIVSCFWLPKLFPVVWSIKSSLQCSVSHCCGLTYERIERRRTQKPWSTALRLPSCLSSTAAVLQSGTTTDLHQSCTPFNRWHLFLNLLVFLVRLCFIMAALCNRCGHYVFALWFLSSVFYLSFFFSSPNLSGRRLDVYHTLTHGVALVQI